MKYEVRDEVAKAKRIGRLAYSLGEVAEMLGVSVGHLRNENARGALRMIKSGRRTLVTDVDLRIYLDSHSLGIQE